MSIFSYEEYSKQLRDIEPLELMIASITHDLRNRSVGAYSGLDVLQNNIDTMSKEDVIRLITSTKQQVQDIKNMLDAVDNVMKSK